MNERITGQRWPAKAERDERLSEAVGIMRDLFAGKTVSRRDGRIDVEEARLYSRPATPPLFVAAALTPETAGRAGGWADALVTISQPLPRLREIVDAFHAGGGEGKKLILQVHLSYAGSLKEARANALDQWRFNALSSSVAAELKLPEQFDSATRHVRVEDLEDSILISEDLGWHAARLAEFAELGFRDIYLHNVGLNQRAFIEAFGARVLPRLHAKA